MTICYLITDYQIYLSTRILGVRYVNYWDFVKGKGEKMKRRSDRTVKYSNHKSLCDRNCKLT